MKNRQRKNAVARNHGELKVTTFGLILFALLLGCHRTDGPGDPECPPNASCAPSKSLFIESVQPRTAQINKNITLTIYGTGFGKSGDEANVSLGESKKFTCYVINDGTAIECDSVSGSETGVVDLFVEIHDNVTDISKATELRNGFEFTDETQTVPEDEILKSITPSTGPTERRNLIQIRLNKHDFNTAFYMDNTQLPCQWIDDDRVNCLLPSETSKKGVKIKVQNFNSKEFVASTSYQFTEKNEDNLKDLYLSSYCQNKGYDGAKATSGTSAFTWYCYKGTNSFAHFIDMIDVCLTQENTSIASMGSLDCSQEVHCRCFLNNCLSSGLEHSG